eukprot:Skav235569  [mRNA]  locus=scaffold612:21044:23377:+ [translate_table: standard]
MAPFREDWELLQPLYNDILGHPKDLEDFVIIERVLPGRNRHFMLEDDEDYCVVTSVSEKMKEVPKKAEVKKPPPFRVSHFTGAAQVAASFATWLKWQSGRP